MRRRKIRTVFVLGVQGSPLEVKICLTRTQLCKVNEFMSGK